MIKSTQPIFTTLLLLGGSFLMLSTPTWISYILLASMATTYAVYLVYRNLNTIKSVWHIFTEFIGFCFLVALFVGTVVIMNGLIMY